MSLLPPIRKFLALTLLIALNMDCLAVCPKIAYMSGEMVFDNPSFAQISRQIFDESGNPIYVLTCRSGDLDDDGDFNYSGLFHCRLSVAHAKKSESHSILFEDRRATSDWEGRARFLLNDVLGHCGKYPDWGSVRTFMVRGMRIVLRVTDVTLIAKSRPAKAKLFKFSYEIAPDKRAESELASASPIKEPPWFNGGDTCLRKYDAEGGLLQDDTRSYSWNAQGLPTQLGAVTLEYDGLGKPIREDGQVLIWCRDPGGEERICAKSSGIAKSDTPPVSIHNWGENDRKGKIGQVFYSKGNANNDEGYFRLIGLGGDGRYWYYPSKGSHRNAWWQYLGSEAPQQEISIWGENDRRGKIGQIFQSLGGENHDFGYFRLIALGGDGRYWYYPNKGNKRNTWWEYLGTEIPSDTEFYYTQGERRGNTAYAYVRDHLGSVVGLVNSGGTLSDQTEYDAYGAARSGGKKRATALFLNTSPYLAIVCPFRPKVQDHSEAQLV